MAKTNTATNPRARRGSTGFKAALKKAKTDEAAAKKKGKGDPLYQMALFTGATSGDTLPVEPGVQDVQRIAMGDIFKPEGFNSRRQLWGSADKGEDLDSMVASLKEHGLLEPIVVCRKDFGSKVNAGKGTTGEPDVRYALIVGERRYSALEHMNVAHVSAVVMTCSLKKALRLNKVENTHRKALAPWELAIACHEAKGRGGRKWRPMTAADLSMSPESVSNYCGAYDLVRPHAEAWDAFQRGALGPRQIIALRTATKKRAKKDSVELCEAFVRVWGEYVAEADGEGEGDTPGKGRNGAGKPTNDRPSRKDVREMMSRFGLALGPAGKMKADKHRAWTEGAYFILQWQAGEALETEQPQGTYKAIHAARERAGKEAARIDAQNTEDRDKMRASAEAAQAALATGGE